MSKVQIKIDTKKIEKELNKRFNTIANNIIDRERDDSMELLTDTEKELLEHIIKNKNNNYVSTVNTGDLPIYINSQTDDLLKTLKKKKYIANSNLWMGAFQATLTPEGINYKEIEEEKKKTNQQNSINIGEIINNGGTNIIGNVYDSTFNIDESYKVIEKEIEEKGSEDQEELKEILNEVKDYIENIKNSNYVSKDKGLFNRIGKHINKYQWFYNSIINMVGTAVMTKMGGN